jgi:membrane protease YdiL (CAAX protease family)
LGSADVFFRADDAGLHARQLQNRAAGRLLWLLLIANCLVAPVSEDFAMRGFLFRGWSKSFLGPIGAILPTSAVWTLLHTQYSWVFLAQTFLVGLIFGYWRYRAGSTWLTVIMHGAWNTAVMAQIALMVTDT